MNYRPFRKTRLLVDAAKKTLIMQEAQFIKNGRILRKSHVTVLKFFPLVNKNAGKAPSNIK